ncbi:MULTISPECIES: hypothetical protein [Paenibacillus]|uniref:hypothetical protein n=1 Tax=Paenibacillus TaxID=44249 RepID=UPI0022B91941|nr:hypothetical protein [Paenibacillus caseinilyticus]MCZ8523060.1 hypothetical protein [Paenibacillus caseinilyticus]
MRRISLILLIVTSTILISCGKPKPIPKVNATTANKFVLTPHLLGSHWNSETVYGNNTLLQDKEPDIVPANSKITITFDTPPKENTLAVIYWPSYTGKEFERLKLEDNSFTAPTEKGTYIYSTSGRWAEGNVEYGLKIQVE